MSDIIRRHGLFLLLLLAAGVTVWVNIKFNDTRFDIESNGVLSASPAAISTDFACDDCLVPSVHGANLVELKNGNLLATWFGGSREGGKDVVIWGADYSHTEGKWSKPRRVVGPDDMHASLGRYIKTVGNSVLVKMRDGRLALYFVSVSVGGWAGSALNVIYSVDEGQSWGTPVRLITSPFFNVSTLNKTTPVPYRDGSIGLPVYHEFIGKFAELLRVDEQGNVLDKYRITSGRHSIQPVVLPLSEQHAIALMRDTVAEPGRVLMSMSDDGGMSWSTDTRTSLPNPDAAVAGLRRPDGSLLLVLNDLEAGRNRLSLAISRNDGEHWQIVRTIESSADGAEFSYPYLIRARDGKMHLVFTWKRKQIRHVVFNDQWIEVASR